MHKYLESNYHSEKLKIPCAQFILTNSNSKQELVSMFVRWALILILSPP